MNLLKSVLHNIGVVMVGFALAYVGTMVDSLLGISAFGSSLVKAAGLLLVLLGFLIRVWATFHFYAHKMRVISLEPQKTLITSGPYRFSRNPLYLGGNVFIFFGAALLFGSPMALLATAIHIPFLDSLSVGKKNSWSEFSAEHGWSTGNKCADGFKPISRFFKMPSRRCMGSINT